MLKMKICRTRCGEEMHVWGENIKKRRAQQIRSIQHGQTSYPFQKEWEMTENASLWKQPPTNQNQSSKWIRKITVQSVLSIMLFVVTYVMFHSDSASKAVITEVMNRPYNFQGVTAWFRENIGTSPTILPAFRSETENQAGWMSPVSGKIILPFNRERNGVVIRTQQKAKIVAPADGWVMFAGEKEGIGRTVILQHMDGKQTWLSLLASYKVNVKQWVKKGEPIGVAGMKSGQSYVYIAIKENGKFRNPTEVISFD